MDELDEIIKQINDEFGEGTATTADNINRPEPKQSVKEIDLFNEFNIRNPLAGGGMLAQPSADGSRQEYATSTVKTKKFKYPITNQFGTFYSDKKPKSSAKEIGSGKFSMAERNRVTRIKYPEYNSYSELLKKEPKKARVVMSTLQYASVAGTKIKKKTRFTPLTIIQQNKILAEFPSANFDEGKLGFNSETDQTKYQQVKKFIERGYKPRFKKIPEKLQEDIKQKFSYFKDWDFNKYKYGVPGSGGGGKGNIRNRENNVLAQRVKRYISEPKPFKLAFSMDRPGSWMLQQMYRAWEHGNTDYEPIYNKNDKVIGMKENGKTYYANKNVAPSNKVKLINFHPEFNKVQKFVDVANEAKLPLKDLSGYKNTKSLLALFPEGYESIKFNDLVSYLYKEQGVDATRNAIEKHHLKSLSDMGAPVDSKNLQLLRKDLNTLGNTITQQIKKGDLSRVADLEKAGVKITVDGKTYGKGFQDPRRQFNRIIGDITQKVSSLDKTQLDNLLLKLSGQIDSDCAGAIKQASKDGGRIGLQAIGSRDVCITKAKNYARDQVAKGIPDTGVKGSLIKRIFKSTSDFVKSALDPKELFDIKKQFFSKGAIASLPIFDAAIAGYEALAMNKPVKEAVSNTLTFGSIPRAMGIGIDTPEVLQAKQLLQNPKLSPAGKEYAQLIIDQGEYEKLQSNVTGGVTEKFKNFKNLQNKIKNASTAGRFDYQSLLDEIQATQLAKDNYSPLIGSLGDPLKNRAVAPRTGTRQGPGPVKIDLSPITYQNFKPDIASKEDLENYFRAEGYISEDEQLTPEFYQQEFVKPAEFEQLMELPSFRGASEKFAGGGIAKIAGIDQGPPPESGPNSQGLKGLFNRVKNI